MTNNTEEFQPHSGFISGFVAGIAASAVGYFFFGTERGKRLKTILNEKWHEAQVTNEGASENQDFLEPTTLRQALRTVVDQVMSAVEQTDLATQKKGQKRSPKKRKRKKMFQGVK